MRNIDLTQLSARDAIREMDAGRLTSRTLVDALLERIAKRDADVGAFAHLDPGKVRAGADAADRSRASGEPPGSLSGVPVAVKDIIDLADELKVPVREISRGKFEALARTDAPQGVLAMAAPSGITCTSVRSTWRTVDSAENTASHQRSGGRGVGCGT